MQVNTSPFYTGSTKNKYPGYAGKAQYPIPSSEPFFSNSFVLGQGARLNTGGGMDTFNNSLYSSLFNLLHSMLPNSKGKSTGTGNQYIPPLSGKGKSKPGVDVTMDVSADNTPAELPEGTGGTKPREGGDPPPAGEFPPGASIGNP